MRGRLEGNVLEMFLWRCCFNAVLGPLAAAAFTGGICHNLALKTHKCWCWVFSCCPCRGWLELGKVRSRLPQERLSREISSGRGKERSAGRCFVILVSQAGEDAEKLWLLGAGVNSCHGEELHPFHPCAGLSTGTRSCRGGIGSTRFPIPQRALKPPQNTSPKFRD